MAGVGPDGNLDKSQGLALASGDESGPGRFPLPLADVASAMRMKLILPWAFLVVAIGFAKAESSVTNPAIAIADTAWAFSDSRGQHFEIRFGSGGTATIRRLRSHWVKDPRDPDGPPVATRYEIEILQSGKWVQRDSAVEFRIEDVDITNLPAGTHPRDLYSGTVGGFHLAGEVKSETYGPGRWAADLVREPKDRSDGPPMLLLAISPDFPFASDSKTGAATIRAKVSPSGDVSETSVVKASGKEFGRKAADAIAQWKFLPAVRGGEALAASVVIPVSFALHSN